MIRNLNRISFKDFGVILDDIADEKVFSVEYLWQDQRLTVSENAGKAVCYPDNPVYLERTDGMAVLGVSRDEQDEPAYFYLDKPVRVNPGIWILLQPLGSICTVRQITCQDGIHRYAQLSHSGPHYSLSPALIVKDIYTLFYQEREKGFFFRGEQHHPYELIYVDRGELHSVAAGQDILLRQGEMILYSPDQWHMQYTDSSRSVCFITLSFDMDCPYGDQLTNRRQSADEEAVRLLNKMLVEQDENEFLRDDALLCYLKELLLHLLRQVHSEKPANRRFSTITTTRENEIVEEALVYISSHAESKMSVSSVARGVNVSTSYMSALFRKHLGFSPSVYIRRMKLSEGKQLIREGNRNLTEISQLLGYSTLQHFSRCFKDEYGITPSEYARAMKYEI